MTAGEALREGDEACEGEAATPAATASLTVGSTAADSAAEQASDAADGEDTALIRRRRSERADAAPTGLLRWLLL